MKIHLSSDLHLEFRANALATLPETADVIVLAGDIHVGFAAADVVRTVAEAHANAQVLFVPGNHEYYDSDISTLEDYLRRSLQGITNAHYLDREVIIIDGVRFIGATLWTGFDILPQFYPSQAMREARVCLADFVCIHYRGTLLTPRKMASLYARDRAWLQEQLGDNSHAKTVVVTHFAPCLETEHQTIPRSPLTSYFQANCEPLIRQYQPDLWLFGHNHWNIQTQLGETRLVSNHGGYPGELGSYDPGLLIKV